jgi:hypothetical protein
MKAQSPDRSKREEQHEIKAGLKTPERVFLRVGQGQPENHRRRYIKACSRGKESPCGRRHPEADQSTQNRVCRHFELRVPLSIEAQQAQSEQPRQYDAVFVMRAEQVGPFQMTLEPGLEKVSCFRIPLIVNRQGSAMNGN